MRDGIQPDLLLPAIEPNLTLITKPPGNVHSRRISGISRQTPTNCRIPVATPVKRFYSAHVASPLAHRWDTIEIPATTGDQHENNK